MNSRVVAASSGRRRLVNWTFAGALIAAAGVASAPPAAAHGGDAIELAPSNYRVSIDASTRHGGISVRTTDAGTRFELASRPGSEVVVIGYDGEPYLKVNRSGVWENSYSPAILMNGSMSPVLSGPVPDASVRPQWRHVASDPTARWHDHRAHWMAPDPDEVVAEPGQRHTVQKWVIPLEIDGEEAQITGIIEWVPPPSGWRWLSAAAAVALVGFVLLRWRPRMVLALVTAVSTVTLVVNATGLWLDSSEALADRMTILTLPLLAVAMFGGAVGTLSTRRTEARVLVLTGSLIVLAAVSLGSGPWLSHSQLSTVLDPDVARASIAVATGLAVGAGWWSALVLLGPVPRRSIRQLKDRLLIRSG